MSYFSGLALFQRLIVSRPAGLCRLTIVIVAMCTTGALSAQEVSDPEEPDFFFLTGGPYTQQKYSPQIIWATQWLHHGSVLSMQEFTSRARFEFGVTDRLEADFELGARSTRQELQGVRLVENELEAALIGARYRILTEETSPLTLTAGPQITIPLPNNSIWENRPSYGVDLTAAKDWGGPVFAAASLNWHLTPGVRAYEQSPDRASLDQLSYAVALGFRPLERTTQSATKHDIHLFMEALRSSEETVESGAISREALAFLAPGVRYGFSNKSGVLTELGIAIPLGLTRVSPDWGVLVQFQMELPTLF